jgi:hypothetical protein
MGGPADAPVSFAGLRLADLYCMGFFFIGLYFVLSSLAPTITWAHHTFLVVVDAPVGNPETRRSLYQLLEPGITLAAGFACVLNGRQWAERLARRPGGTEPTAPGNDAPPGSLPTTRE